MLWTLALFFITWDFKGVEIYCKLFSAVLTANLSASMRSQTSNRTGSMTSLVQIDDHKQLKEIDRPEEPGYSSDPDTSLFEYEDDKSVYTVTIVFPY